MGATDPKKAEEETIRKKYGISIDKNSVHGSDSLDNANIEIEFFFFSTIIPFEMIFDLIQDCCCCCCQYDNGVSTRI